MLSFGQIGKVIFIEEANFRGYKGLLQEKPIKVIPNFNLVCSNDNLGLPVHPARLIQVCFFSLFIAGVVNLS